MRAIVLVLCLATAGGIVAYTHYWGDQDNSDAPVYTVTLPPSEPTLSALRTTAREVPAPSAPEAAAAAAASGDAPGAPPAPAPAIDTSRIAPDDRAALARALQRELKRVGCYQGKVTGAWGKSSRAAMQAFVDRVNATLPTDKPDPVLLSLVEGQRDPVCGAACPEGQTAAVNGACMPDAVVAKVKQPKVVDPPDRGPDSWSADVSPSGPVPPEGMARRRPPPPRRAAQQPQPPKVIRDILGALGLD